MNKKVLLVDDDESIIEVLTDALEAEGFEVLKAENGEEGVAAALTAGPDVIISDIVMPKVDGWELCQTLRSLPSTKTIPFIFLTSLDKAPEKVLASRLGADDYLTKPFNMGELMGKVRTLMARVNDRDELLGGAETATGGDRTQSLLVDTIETLLSTGRTGIVIVSAGPTKGIVYFAEGHLSHASFGSAEGESALLSMLRLPECQVRFKEGVYPNLPANFRLSWVQFMSSLSDRGSWAET